MVRFFPLIHPYDQRKVLVAFLALLWIFGLLSGVVIGYSGSPAFYDVMRAAAASPRTAGGTVLSSILPALISAVAVHTSHSQILFLLAFFKALVLGFLASGVWIFFGSAGWLVCLLCFGADFLSCGVYLWLWLQILSRSRRLYLRCGIACLLIGILNCFDYLIVSSFLVELLSL